MPRRTVYVKMREADLKQRLEDARSDGYKEGFASAIAGTRDTAGKSNPARDAQIEMLKAVSGILQGLTGTFDCGPR